MKTREKTPGKIAARTVAALTALGTGVFAVWQKSLSVVADWSARAARALRAYARAWTAQWSMAVKFHADPAMRDEAGKMREAAAAIGVRAFVFGLIAGAAFAVSKNNSYASGFAVVAGEVLWAAARFIIIGALLPRDVTDRTQLSAAFLAGLLPYALGFTPALRTVALAISALLTYRGMTGGGIHKSEARLATGWAFGGQAGVVLAGWLVRIAVTLLAGF